MTTWKLCRDDGTVVETPIERWRWEAHYTDGTILKQFDDEGRFHQFKEIEQDRLKIFGMVHNTCAPVMLHWKEGMKLIHYYKNFHLNAFTPNEQKFKFYCFGYETKDEKIIMTILPNDSVLITNDIDKFLATTGV
jgi:hypothetical protein